MSVLDPESEAVIRRVEASIDLDEGWAAVQRRSSRARAAAMTRRFLAAAVVLVLLGGVVAIRAAGDRSAPSLHVGGPGLGGAPTVAPALTGDELPFLVPDAAMATITGLSVQLDATRQFFPDAPGLLPNPRVTPAAIYASADDSGPLLAIESADAEPTTVGTGPSRGGEPFTAGPWHGTLEVTGSPGHEVRTAVVRDADASGEAIVVTARQIDDAELVRHVTGLHRIHVLGEGLRLADDSGLSLVSDAVPGANGDRWEARWDVGGESVGVDHYRETGDPRFIERLAASPTMTRIAVGGRPGAVFESGGYTVFSWLPTASDVVEIRVSGEGPDAVARAAALARGSRSATRAELEQQYPNLMLSPNEAAGAVAPFQQGTPLPPGSDWSAFAPPATSISETELRMEVALFAACAWFDRWRGADAAGDAAGADAARAALNSASGWAAMAGSPSLWPGVVGQFADGPTPPDASTIARTFGCPLGP